MLGDISGSSNGIIPQITVNMMWCVPGAVGGSEEYLVRQLLGLPADVFDVTVCAPRGFAAAHDEVASRYRIVELSHDAQSRGRRIFSESTELFIQSKKANLVHHGGGTIPARHRSPSLLTIHDLQYRQFPQYFRASKLAYLKYVMPRSARRADLIAVPSEFVKQTVIEAYKIDAQRIVVIPHGVEGTLGVHATPQEELCTKYNLGTGPIVVMPAITHPHKGHHFLLNVMKKFWAQEGICLVLIGGEGLAEESVQQRLSEDILSQSVRKLGRVSNADRDGLLKMAEALIFPSEYEGFGAPVVEAMALGVPVISSDQACLPEVIGNAGLVLGLDEEAWAGALQVVQDQRSEFIARGLERAKLFTSEISGQALAAAYRRIIS
ncbi:MAG: glycosyltransferase family 1 protein [Ilumatobacteraceae bacterium]|nr:glycosyltransferase family 1 protein [Ilumatobacteraceae bacterium]